MDDGKLWTDRLFWRRTRVCSSSWEPETGLTAAMQQLLATFLACVVTAGALRLEFVNNMRETVWVGSLGNAGKPPVDGGGWKMDPGSRRGLDVADDWAGRFWGRTGCRPDGSACATGDCGRGTKCGGSGGAPPATLAEFTFRGWGGNDYYDISLVDGFNVPMSIEPISQRRGGDRFRCTRATCRADVNGNCPRELRVNSGNRVVGCKSACLAFNTDQYCCRDNHGTPDTCRSSNWPVNYPATFKRLCPDAYSYAYDDHKSTFTCANTGYKITFG